MMDKRLSALVRAIVAASVISFPSIAGAATHPHKHHESKAARHYLAIVKPANTATAAFQSAVAAAGTTATGSTLAADAAPLVSAYQTVEHKLTTYRWPKKARADVRTLVRAISAANGVLAKASTVNALSASSWVQQLASAESSVSADVGFVRADLGLRQAK